MDNEFIDFGTYVKNDTSIKINREDSNIIKHGDFKHEMSIEQIISNGVIQRLIVTCACGKTQSIDFEYDA